MTTAYQGLRVLDASAGIAGAMAAMYLADQGADVIISARRYRAQAASVRTRICAAAGATLTVAATRSPRSRS
jgi:crotonobetainyl-CoA:carnitine CoA-transferase CaiB-like acyl-CoA transferase